MTRAIRSNLMPLVVALLVMLPAAMGVAPGMVRCEHADATTHVAPADHHAGTAVDACCAGVTGHGTPAPDGSETPDAPAEPCDDTPLDLEPAPVSAASLQFDLPDAPLLPVLAWDQHDADRLVSAMYPGERRDRHPPGPEPCLILKTARFLI